MEVRLLIRAYATFVSFVELSRASLEKMNCIIIFNQLPDLLEQLILRFCFIKFCVSDETGSNHIGEETCSSYS
jgi:hypothetical protein